MLLVSLHSRRDREKSKEMRRHCSKRIVVVIPALDDRRVLDWQSCGKIKCREDVRR